MAQTYKVTAVSPKKDEWDSHYGKMVTYYVQVDGNEEPIQVNKKVSSPAPETGEELYGTINETQWGKKFKSEKKPYSQGGGYGGGYKADPDKQNQIKAQWAIGQAVGTVDWSQKGVAIYEAVEQRAKEFYAMVDRVKESPATETQLPLPTVTKPKEEDVVVTDIGDEPINLDDIPF